MRTDMNPDDAASLRATGAVQAPVLPARLTSLTVLGAAWGPGLLVMLADTNAGNIITAAEAGTAWRFRLVLLPLMLIPALALHGLPFATRQQSRRLRLIRRDLQRSFKHHLRFGVAHLTRPLATSMVLNSL